MLDDSSASKSLLSVVKHMEDKTRPDRTLLVRVFFNDKNDNDVGVYKVLSGDPSKGAIAIDTVRELKRGMRVQFLCVERGEMNFFVSFCFC